MIKLIFQNIDDKIFIYFFEKVRFLNCVVVTNE